jgi:hypothetical protein
VTISILAGFYIATLFHGRRVAGFFGNSIVFVFVPGKFQRRSSHCLVPILKARSISTFSDNLRLNTAFALLVVRSLFARETGDLAPRMNFGGNPV